MDEEMGMMNDIRAAIMDDSSFILTGTVCSGIERAAAEPMVAELTGVRGVRNDIRLREA
jgi:hypothetical protein